MEGIWRPRRFELFEEGESLCVGARTLKKEKESKMSNYTKGPWVAKKVQTQSGYADYWVISEKQYNGFQICSTGTDEVTEGAANARLIAAAPDLLDTCKWVLGCLENLPFSTDAHSAKRELIAVIAKAEGK